MHDIQTPQEPRFETGKVMRWVICAVVLVLLAYQSFSNTASTFADLWPQLKAVHFGFSPVSHGAGLALSSIRRSVESNGILLVIAVLCVWLLPRRRADAGAVMRSDDGRRVMALALLAFPFLVIPSSLMLLLWTVIEFQSGKIDYPNYGGFFATLVMCVFYFVLLSELIYGRRNTATNDELRQHFRSKALKSGYWAMLITGAILYAAAIASPLWASMALPLALLAGVIVPMIRFALLELFTGVG